MRRRIILLICLLLQACAPVWAKGQRVWVAVSGTDAPYMEAAKAVRGRLADHDVTIRPWADLVDSREAPPRVVVALGVEAANRMAEATASWPKTAVVVLLVPRSHLEKLAETRSGRVTGVYFDQPFSRLGRFLKLAIADKPRVGVLLGPTSLRYQGEIRQALRTAGFDDRIETVESRDGLPDSLRDVVGEVDVLLAIPDPLVFNSQSAHFILLSSYKRGIPLIGYSESFVKAGAAAALVSTPEQVGIQGGDMVAGLLDGEAVPPPRGPENFRVMVNGNVARSLGMSLDSEVLDRKMGAREP